MNTVTREPYITAEQVAEFFAISKRSLARFKAAGIIPFHRLGPRGIRFKFSEVEKALIGGVK